MKISAYIEALEKIKEEHGDLHLAVQVIREYDGKEFLSYMGFPSVEDFDNVMDYDDNESLESGLVAIIETRLE